MATDLLPGYDASRRDRREIARKRRKCRLIGHLWHLESYEPPHRYHLFCVRCFPHIQSRMVTESYNLFSMTPQKESD